MSYQRLTETICAVTLTLFATSALAEPPIWESNFGPPIVLADCDDDAQSVTLSFPFPFDGINYTTVFIGVNGGVQLGSLGRDGEIDFDHWSNLEEFLDEDVQGVRAPSIAAFNSDLSCFFRR
jgi:hypothetical protein